MKLILSIIFISIAMYSNCLSQTLDSKLDPKWEQYYNKYPSLTKKHYQATDFITIIDLLGFIPQSKPFERDVNLLKKLLLRLDQDVLDQMIINGWYLANTYKHDDYYYLYNITYKKISKDLWDKYCPFLIPLMQADQVIGY